MAARAAQHGSLPNRVHTYGKRSLAIVGLTLAWFSVGVATAAPPSTGIFVSRADLVWSDRSTRTTLTEVAVAELVNGDLKGEFLLVDTAGPIATLALARVAETGVGCLRRVSFRVVGAIDHVPADPAHVVVIGPLDAPAPKARLMFLGLAVAGHVAPATVEPLGVAGPGGGEPTYAVDLDGDRVADVFSRRSEQHGPFVNGLAEVRHVEEHWRRARSWKQTRACKWTSVDTLR